jgi:hypothetical protein
MNPHTACQPADAVHAHDAGLTAVGVARQLDEIAHALTYATLPRAARLEHASDVYEVLGSLNAALAKLPQACGQLASFLERQQSAGVLRAEHGFPHAGRPSVAVAEAAFKLGHAAVAANVTATAFGRAQTAISGLSHDGSAPTPPPRTSRNTPTASPTIRAAVAEP